MNQFAALAVVGTLGLLVAAAGGSLGSLLISVVGLLVVVLAGGAAGAVWLSDPLDATGTVPGGPDALEE